MDTRELRRRLIERGVTEECFRLDGYELPERYILSKGRTGWSCYYFERGERVRLRHFPTEHAACEYFLDWVSSDSSTHVKDLPAAQDDPLLFTGNDFQDRAAALLPFAPATGLKQGWVGPPQFAWVYRDTPAVFEGVTADGRRVIRMPTRCFPVGADDSSVCIITLGTTLRVHVIRAKANAPDLGSPVGTPIDLDSVDDCLSTSWAVVESVVFPALPAEGPVVVPVVTSDCVPPVVSFPINGDRSDRGPTALAVWQPPNGRIRIVPLAWFNDETIDVGYQWLMRSAFDRSSGLVFADGARISPFAVSLDGVKQWQDRRPHPGSP